MAHTWLESLNAYHYPVDLSCYPSADHFLGFFDKAISGDRQSTTAFEDYFRQHAPSRIEVWYEVAFWKLGSRFSRTVDSIVRHTQEHGLSAHTVWASVQKFTKAPTRQNLAQIRAHLGFSTEVLPVPLTFVAFAMPAQFPMVDSRVADWANDNLPTHNARRDHQLLSFKNNYTSLRDNDFEAYLSWTFWCREVAAALSRKTTIEWRARDVEMAVFTASRDKRILSALH